MSWPVDCANCGKQTLMDDPGDKCIWCGKSPYKKEGIVEEVNFNDMSLRDRGKYIEKHLTEIIEDIRALPKREVLKKWPFGQSTFAKLKKEHAPELIGKRPTYKPRQRKDEKPPATDKEAPGLTEHERYLILVGYQMAAREFLGVHKN